MARPWGSLDRSGAVVHDPDEVGDPGVVGLVRVPPVVEPVEDRKGAGDTSASASTVAASVAAPLLPLLLPLPLLLLLRRRHRRRSLEQMGQQPVDLPPAERDTVEDLARVRSGSQGRELGGERGSQGDELALLLLLLLTLAGRRGGEAARVGGGLLRRRRRRLLCRRPLLLLPRPPPRPGARREVRGVGDAEARGPPRLVGRERVGEDRRGVVVGGGCFLGRRR